MSEVLDTAPISTSHQPLARQRPDLHYFGGKVVVKDIRDCVTDAFRFLIKVTSYRLLSEIIKSSHTSLQLCSILVFKIPHLSARANTWPRLLEKLRNTAPFLHH